MNRNRITRGRRANDLRVLGRAPVDLELSAEDLEPGPFTKRVISRSEPDEDGAVVVTLECGHLVTRIVDTGAAAIPCAECLFDYLKDQRAGRAKAKGAKSAK